MRQFTDSKGRVWEIPALDLPSIRDVKKATGINLTSEVAFESMVDEKLGTVDVLRVLCRKQISAASMKADDFDALFDPDTLDAAHDALTLATTDFFPKRRREAFQAMYETKQKEEQQKLAKLMSETSQPAP